MNAPYFASFNSDSDARRTAVEMKYIHDESEFFALEKNDEAGVFDSDGQAIQQCIKDALNGSVYALKQLMLAANDPLVRQYMEELK